MVSRDPSPIVVKEQKKTRQSGIFKKVYVPIEDVYSTASSGEESIVEEQKKEEPKKRCNPTRRQYKTK